MDERSQEALNGWYRDSYEYLLRMTADWQGTGHDGERRVISTSMSLHRVLNFVLVGDVKELWRDADPLALNGVLNGGMVFGVIPHRNEGVVVPELEDWFADTKPRPARDWSVHS